MEDKKNVRKPKVHPEWLFGGNPRAIEDQEAEGQVSFVGSDTLPKEINWPENGWKILEKFGIQRLEDADDLFVYVNLPEGWRKEPTDHAMWSKLVDEHGRKRASMFYKAAFYDQRAFINVNRRFGYHTRPLCGYENEFERETEPQVCAVLDGEKEIWVSDPITPEGDDKKAWYRLSDLLQPLGEEWLKENYPDWEDYTAYWDEE